MLFSILLLIGFGENIYRVDADGLALADTIRDGSGHNTGPASGLVAHHLGAGQHQMLPEVGGQAEGSGYLGGNH